MTLGQDILSFSEILHCEWYWKSHSLNIASVRCHNQQLTEQEKRCLFPHAHGGEAQGGVLQESEEGVLQVLSDEEMEKLEAIPGVLGLAVEMGFL